MVCVLPLGMFKKIKDINITDNLHMIYCLLNHHVIQHLSLSLSLSHFVFFILLSGTSLSVAVEMSHS